VDCCSWPGGDQKHKLRPNPFIGFDIDQKVQVVLCFYDALVGVLVGFDCDCSCCAFDGDQVWASDQWVYTMQYGVNALNPIHAWPNKTSDEIRLAKYAHCGFPLVIPGLDQRRIDPILKQPVKFLKGLAHFLRIAFASVLVGELFTGFCQYEYHH
jgi:hypothetical protein